MCPQPLRIAMLSVHSCPVGKLGSRDTGGMNVYIRELARELGRRGNSVDIYTRAHDPSDDQVIELGDRTRVIHLKVGEVDRMHKLVLYSHLADMACASESFRKANDLSYDLVHSHYWLSGWVGSHLRRWWKAPHFTMFHTLAAVKNEIGVGEDEPELRVANEADLARDSDRIIAATRKEMEDLVRCYGVSPEKISVIPCGVNLHLFRSMDRKAARQRLGLNGGRIVLFVGRVEPLKGIDRLLQAISGLSAGPGLTLLVVGGDEEGQPEMERLRDLSRSLEIEDAVNFVGAVPQEDLPLYYSAADVCVVPSHYESFGLVALESMACGTPVVATRVGSMESVVSHGRNGYLVKDNAPVNLADAIAALTSSPVAQNDSADSIRRSIAEYDWAYIAEAMEEEYRRVLSDTASGRA
jgi:D-inositol-3-phosphate glycosyltransferase